MFIFYITPTNLFCVLGARFTGLDLISPFLLSCFSICLLISGGIVLQKKTQFKSEICIIALIKIFLPMKLN